jgi:hypothetical protein
MLLVVNLREGFDRSGESGVGRDVGNAPPGVPDLAAVAQRANVISPFSTGHEKTTPISPLPFA